MGLTTMADDIFRVPRRGKNTQHELMGKLRQAVYNGETRPGSVAGRGYTGNLG